MSFWDSVSNAASQASQAANQMADSAVRGGQRAGLYLEIQQLESKIAGHKAQFGKACYEHLNKSIKETGTPDLDGVMGPYTVCSTAVEDCLRQIELKKEKIKQAEEAGSAVPAAAAAAPPAAAPPPPPPPSYEASQFVEYTDPKTGAKYWHNPQTGETTWHKP